MMLYGLFSSESDVVRDMTTFDGNRNLTHQVTYELGRAIVQGKYKVGDHFPTEAQMCQHYRISRSVVREAVKMLTAKGLISSRPRQGIRVLPPSAWNVFDVDVLQWTLTGRPSLELLREFNELRSTVEPEAAALAARHQSPEAIEAIGRALERVRLAGQGEDDPLEANIEFHTSILLASNNRFFIQLRNFIQTALRVSTACSSQLLDAVVGRYGDHKSIYDAISEGDARAAQSGMSALLGESCRQVAGIVELRAANSAGLAAIS